MGLLSTDWSNQDIETLYNSIDQRDIDYIYMNSVKPTMNNILDNEDIYSEIL